MRLNDYDDFIPRDYTSKQEPLTKEEEKTLQQKLMEAVGMPKADYCPGCGSGLEMGWKRC